MWRRNISSLLILFYTIGTWMSVTPIVTSAFVWCIEKVWRKGGWGRAASCNKPSSRSVLEFYITTIPLRRCASTWVIVATLFIPRTAVVAEVTIRGGTHVCVIRTRKTTFRWRWTSAVDGWTRTTFSSSVCWGGWNNRIVEEKATILKSTCRKSFISWMVSDSG